jgi:hypothetical protein
VDSELLARAERVDGDRVEQVARAALGREAATVHTWHYEVLPYTQFISHRLLLRFSGEAVDAGRTYPWTAILKLARPSTPEHFATSDIYATREVQAYRSGLLADLSGGLTAPRLLLLSEDEDGATRLWLEDVRDRFRGGWPLTYYEVAARHLGQFNGSYLVDRALPSFSWLDAEWDGGHTNPAAVADWVPRIADLVSHDNVRRLFPTLSAEPVKSLLERQSLFLRVLSDLPQTLCHHEAARANLIARLGWDGEEETVAIDWETVGLGPVGAEIATLVFGTLRRLEVPAAQATLLEELVLRGYMRGLAEAGWRGDANLVRLGYALAISLRWSFITGFLEALVDSTAQTRLVSTRGRSMGDLVAQYVPLTSFLLDHSMQAEQLMREFDLR